MKKQFMSAVTLAADIRAGRVTVKDAVEAVYEEIEKREEECHAYLYLRDKEEVLLEAERLQADIFAGKYADSMIAGVPVAVKDNICMEGYPTTCASKMLENFVPPYSATAVKRLQEAGALILGKTNMDEFGMGSTTETSYFGVTRNPHNPERVPGGSSGGSAAAVAAGECVFSIGSDTGGSIRQPGSYCGLVGIKPTYGTVSRYGLIAYTSSLEQIGPMTNTVEDCAAVLQIIAGKDDRDSTSVDVQKRDYLSLLKQGVENLRIGLPSDFLVEGVQREVAEAVRQAAALLERLGAKVEEFELGMSEYVVPIYCTITAAEASSNLARFDGVKYGHRTEEYTSLQEMGAKSRAEGFGREVTKRILLGTEILGEGNYERFYEKAVYGQKLLRKTYEKAFEKYDVILGPVAPRTAPVIAEKNKDTLTSRLEDIYTVPANLTGIPAITVPFGKDDAGMPIGIQLLADHFREDILFRAAYSLEQNKRNGGREQ